MPAQFPSTRWSLVERAGEALGPVGQSALDELCGAYWFPLFAYLRRSGLAPEEAADQVQGLFLSLLERESLARVRREGGRFRSWLLGAMRHHLQDERAKRMTLKRGEGQNPLSLDLEGAEARYAGEAGLDLDPAAQFERAWAQEVLQRALSRLESNDRAAGRGQQFELLRPTLLGETIDRAAVGRHLGLSTTALRVGLHRLRQRYQECLLDEVRDTLGEDQATGDELGELLRALGQEFPAPE